MNPSPSERSWIRTIPDSYPDIMRAPAVTYKAERDLARIKANSYVAFARPYRGKQGLLLIGKQQRPVIIDESQSDKPQIVPMRLDRESIHGTWIFAITIYRSEGLIQIEDCIVADSQEIRSTKTFKERYTLLQKFTDTIWCKDLQFQLNSQIELARMYSLAEIRIPASQSQNGGSLCLMPDLPSLRLLKVLPETIEKNTSINNNTNRNGEYICIPVIGKPDVYDLVTVADQKPVGRASIQTLTISQALQQKRMTAQSLLKVFAEWNEDFESYVVTSVIS